MSIECEDGTGWQHDIDIDPDKEYSESTGRKIGVACRRCGQILADTGMFPRWIDYGLVNREAKCYNSKLPLYV